MTIAKQDAASSGQLNVVAPVCLIVTFIFQIVFTYGILKPSIGFDDANITQVYARHLAEGHGYVYNIGGERVEGSTSILWTVMNAAMFLTPYPIMMITVTSGLLTVGTMAFTGLITRSIGGSVAAVATSYLLFNLFPGFFSWSIWSLMDISLWVFAVTVIVWSLVRLDDPKIELFAKVTLVVSSFCLPLVRPEGIALVLGLLLFCLVFRRINRKPLSVVIGSGLAAITSLIAVTLWRLSYFGYPVPNTFYAKTSSNLSGQIQQGFEYISGFVGNPTTVLLFVFSAIGVMIIQTRSNQYSARFFSILVLYLTIGGFIVYTILGGDHFGSYRFMIYLYPLSIPLASIAIVNILKTNPSSFGKVVFLLTIVGYTGIALKVFRETNGYLRNELRIAEIHLDIGNELAELHNLPSLATIAAGGIKMGYPGMVYDVLGLNWTEMAHSAETSTDVPKNHGSFSSTIFWKANPEIAFPRPGQCNDEKNSVLDSFQMNLTRHISQTERFANRFVAMCNEKVVLYASREVEPLLQQQGYEYYFD
ncbi:hypothetical protein [Ruegeria profundi]|uniref:hypothetical protein n=1 Tax=Ruegeria profundi TaxID=1685378 RepID=UPI003C79CFE8